MTSKTIAEFVSYLKDLDVRVSITGDGCITPSNTRLRCDAPEGTLTPELRQELVERKAELLLYLHQEQKRKQVEELSPQPVDSPTPLSFAQQRLWFLYQFAPDNPFYNVPAAIRFKGSLDRTALEQSFREIVRRHAALRTRFTTLEEQPVQIVEPNANVELTVVDLQTVTDSERERIRHQLTIAEAQRPFDLATDSLLRVTLLQLAPAESVLLLTMHHIVADGWSLGVLIRELAACYTAFVAGRSPRLPPLPMQYPDFARWQRQYLQGEVLEKQLAYWRKQLQDLSVLELPSDRPRPVVQTYRGATYPLQISPVLTQALESLSQQCGTSLFMTLLAAFQTVLYRYTGQEDIAVGAPIANRHHSAVEGLIGFFVNSLVMRSDLSENPSFRELLERVRNVALEAYEHQDLPFEKLVETLDPDRDPSRNPLFQVAFALQNAPMQSLNLPGLTLEPAPLQSGSTRFDLEVHLWEPAHGLRSLWQSQEGLSGFVSYSTDLFDQDRIGRLVGHFQTLLEGIVADPDMRLSDLPLLTSAEHQQILVDWNQTDLQVDQDRCFHHIFAAQANAAPRAIALVSEQGSLTYAELNRQADQLAQTLQHLGVQPASLVGLCVERSADMVIGILGILKAGAAYVPLDPNYPSERLQFMLTDTQVAILLTQSWLVESLPASPAQIFCLDQLPLNLESNQTFPSAPPVELDEPQSSLELENLGDTIPDLAYVIYTSGSTGIPKGVLLTHRGLCNVVEAQQQIFPLCRNSRILQLSSLSFDASIFEIALALGSGGALYIPPKSAQLPGMALVQFLQDNAITHALITPSVLAVLPFAELPDLKVLITGGEACSSQVVDRWAANRHFFNAYGPTETTIWATVAELSPGDNPLTIGRPIPNTQVYVLDAALNPVPIGVPGELYIGGAGLARGYLNRPELTAERFVDHPLSASVSHVCAPSRLYKTGDRVQYGADGRLEFLGRVDHQIKIRGFRVELGEIEATLQRHPAIQEAVVVAEPSNATRLISYFSLNHQHQQSILPALQTQHIQHWQTLYNQTYQGGEQKALGLVPHAQFDITGWNSSDTGEPIPVEQMQEWVNDRVQQILALKPKRVLEIGCGTGLLLFQVAPHCQTYVGTDFSAVSLAAIQAQLESLRLDQVELLHRTATDFEGIDTASFDVVILNSIVQYFPSQDYLMQVLEGAIRSVAPGGAVFVGDVRSLPLLSAFHSWMKFNQADASLERTELQQRVDRSQFEEPELAIDPAFFAALPDRCPQIRQVQVRLSRGRSQNEMTQFRYNVLLHLDPCLSAQTASSQDFSGSNPAELTGKEHHDWNLKPISVEAVHKHLIETEPEIFVITQVVNRRVHAAVKVNHWLQNQTAPKTVGRMRDLLQNSADRAIDPQDWWDSELLLPYRVEITWSTPAHTGNYDVLLIRQGVDASAVSAAFWLRSSYAAMPETWELDAPPARAVSHSCAEYTNNPLQSLFARQLIPELRQYLKQTLPDYMVPAGWVPLATLPLTASGKIDRVRIAEQSHVSLAEQSSQALPPLTADSIASSPLNAPSTPTEATLTEIWQELLRLKQVNIHDNFFELGGHSLLATQMTSRVRDAFGLELPLKNVFEAPTIAQLAPILETLRDAASIATVPPIVRLDRSAYRRKRLSPTCPDTESTPFHDLSSAPDATQIPLIQRTVTRSNIQISEPAVPNQSVANQAAARSPLIPLTLGNSQHPFFCVHPMFGVVFPYLELAHHLGSQHSFYGLQPLGLDGKSRPLNRIEAIAAYYIQAIQTLQPHGPYFLGGWSFGGLVAFEMAQQLTQAGQQIELLAILDTPAPCHKSSFYQSLKFLLGTALWSTLPFLLDYSALTTERLQSRSWVSRTQWAAIARLLPEESRLQLLDESAIRSLLPIVYANSQATYRYIPQPYPQRLTLFKAAEQPDAFKHEPALGWSRLVADVQLHHVPGNHLSLLKQPHVQALAQELGQYLS